MSYIFGAPSIDGRVDVLGARERTARTSIDGRVGVLGARERISQSKNKY